MIFELRSATDANLGWPCFDWGSQPVAAAGVSSLLCFGAVPALIGREERGINRVGSGIGDAHEKNSLHRFGGGLDIDGT